MRLSFYERASCFFLLLLITVGCKKNGDSNQTTYGFGNATGSPVTLDIYGSNADYVTNANALYRYKLDKGGYKDVLLTNGNSYYFDWYTDDYRYNNWSIFYGLDSSYYKIIGGDDPSSFSLGSDYEDGEDTVRSVLLNGNGISSTWSGVAVGLGTTGNSLDSVNGTHQFIFYKDKSCVHMLQGKYGTINDTMRYVIQFYSSGSMGTRNPSVVLLIEPQKADGINYECLSNYDGMRPQTPYRAGRDTLSIHAISAAGGSSPIFLIAKQQ